MSIDESSGWIDAAAAAAILGVRRSTLYTYVSRGQIRSRSAGGRTRRYHESDVRELRARADAHRGGTAAAASALRWGPPVVDTAISDIDRDGPYYRGHSALGLVESGAELEEVAAILWQADGDWDVRDVDVVEAADALCALQVAVADFRRRDPRPWMLSGPAVLSRARHLVRGLVGALGGGEGTLAEALTAALGGHDSEPVRRALVLCADHELNASTFAARVAAGTGADLYSCVSAALGALSGPRHGGASVRVDALLEELERRPRTVAERVARGDGIPGLGHRLYPDGDPRAEVLLEHADDVVRSFVRAVADAGLPAPNLDVGLAAVRRASGLRPGTGPAVFAVGRSVGWIAHVLEQREQGTLLRPRARYVGSP